MKKIMNKLVAAICFSLIGSAFATVQSTAVSYQDGETTLTGYIYWDDAIVGERPGVLVVHEMWGLSDYVKKRATMLAEMGYAAFAVDMYGDGKVTNHPAQAEEWYKVVTANIQSWRQRALLGLEQLRKSELTDDSRLAAIGYCFGGATVMQLAYAGADLKGVVSFHGSLPLPAGDEARMIKGKVLIEHGYGDVFTSLDQVDAFKAALTEAGVDFTFNGYMRVRHAFTNPDADSFGIENLKYDKAADEASWSSMQALFAEIF